MRTENGGYRRDHLRALAQRVEVDSKEVRIMGSKSELLRTLVAASVGAQGLRTLDPLIKSYGEHSNIKPHSDKFLVRSGIAKKENFGFVGMRGNHCPRPVVG